MTGLAGDLQDCPHDPRAPRTLQGVQLLLERKGSTEKQGDLRGLQTLAPSLE